jgi:hypothetical protein
MRAAICQNVSETKSVIGYEQNLQKIYVIESKRVVSFVRSGENGKENNAKMKVLPRTYLKTEEIKN